MHLDILGIGGTFMGGVALLAREAGHTVSGVDAAIYPPMSSLLAEQGIAIRQGYAPRPPSLIPDCVVVGNALSRGNPALEQVLDQRLRYTSGPQWLAEEVMRERWVLAVTGTHGKTTTSSLLTWILEYAGLSPGFLIGGVPSNFGCSARLGRGDLFVIEGDEYDTAFFDKRSKFIHFRPHTLVINNLEFDHADIFPDLAAIQRQFHHLIRTVPSTGLIVANGDDQTVTDTLALGCWTPVIRFGTGAGNDWRLEAIDGASASAALTGKGQNRAITLPLPGEHNARNVLAALLAARHAGVALEQGIEALRHFRGVRRRLELRGIVKGIQLYDDFAHHPTAIAATIAALRGRHQGRILAVLEPRSNTMRLGVHRDTLAASLHQADQVFVYRPCTLEWSLEDALAPLPGERALITEDMDCLIDRITAAAQTGDAVLVMSNGAFENIHERLLIALHNQQRRNR
ncbi:MAG: UDP-N-acetylmuramate:L-alanyl-gamma-D-glutamyl-meso-diaminopimelate ligase [Nitrococcus mobilis]|nr:UDP-N-acetylmuramate:L-alanyl-gamma-D-glutamyl-meso-diaminopimelate ligase [Nitrococcus mobilis]